MSDLDQDIEIVSGEELAKALEGLEKDEIVFLEELAKKCPRCGGASANKSNPSGRCRACLNKLAANKKKPGHWQRAQTKADDALRRQKGKNGTASKKHSGLGSRKSIVKQTQAAEKKTGQKLSPDRKNNSKGYAASNTRMVPEKLNRGRHKVDPKKLAAWRKRVKKAGIELDDLKMLMTAKAYDTGREDLAKTLEMLDDMFLEQFLLDIEDSDLEKGAMRRLAPNPQYKGAIDHSDLYHPEDDASAIKRHQVKLVRDLAHDSGRFKNIDGQLHIKLHRGISGGKQPQIMASPMEVDDTHISHKGHGMYTTDYDYAHEFAGDNGTVHSSWVPISAINKYGNFTGKMSIGNAERTHDPDKGDNEDIEDHLSQYYELQRDDDNEKNHVLVAPGKYRLTSEDE